MSAQVRRGIALLLLLLWFASLLLPTLRTNGSDWGYGWWILASGWMGILVGQFEWLANPLLILAVLLLARKRAARGLLGTAGVLLFLLCAKVAATASLIDNEGGIPHPIELRFVGYWCWLASIGLAGGLSLLAALAPRLFGYPGPDDISRA